MNDQRCADADGGVACKLLACPQSDTDTTVHVAADADERTRMHPAKRIVCVLNEH